jgi:hypothetical protein
MRYPAVPVPARKRPSKMPSVIARFEESVRTNNTALLDDLFADHVRLYGLRWSPFEGKAAVLAVFAMLQDVVDDLEYVSEYEGPDGVALRARGKVGGREFDAVQILQFDEGGLIDECRDLLRPHSAGSALLEALAEYITGVGGDIPKG